MSRRPSAAAAAALAAVTVLVAAAPTPAGSVSGPPLRGEIIGESVGHRPLRIVHVGDPDAPYKVLVVGCIHGNEAAGIAVTRALRHVVPPAGTELLVLDTANPDGSTAGTRGNAHGVDLNRNFPWGWRPLTGVFYAGPHPSSEPETRALEALILRERPAVSIWFHQHLDWVDLQRGSSVALMQRYARASGMRAVRTAGPARHRRALGEPPPPGSQRVCRRAAVRGAERRRRRRAGAGDPRGLAKDPGA